jgi:hypothetical protein
LSGIWNAMPWRAHPKRTAPPIRLPEESEAPLEAETSAPPAGERGEGLVLTDAMCGLYATIKPPRPNA